MKKNALLPHETFSSRAAPTAAGRAQEAYKHLHQVLLEGDLGPGDWITVNDVARDLNCSRVPVMEALKRLAAEGFINIVPQVGCQVVKPEVDEVTDFFELFAAVEGCVTRMAAQRRTLKDLERFGLTCDEVDRLLRDAGPLSARDPAYRRANLLFHSEIHKMARSPQPCRIAAGMWDRSDFYIKLAFGSLHFDRRVRSDHLAIRRAVQNGDADAAERAVERHLRAVGVAVSKRLSATETEKT